MRKDQFDDMHFVLEMNLVVKDHHDVEQGQVKRVIVITNPIKLGLLIAKLSSIMEVEADILIEGEGRLMNGVPDEE